MNRRCDSLRSGHHYPQSSLPPTSTEHIKAASNQNLAKMPRRRTGRDTAESSDDASSSHDGNPHVNGAANIAESLERLGDPLPKLVAFDLDYTCWPLWVDTHVDPPLRRKNDAINKVVDVSGTPLSMYPHVPSILFYLQRKGVVVAAASRTCAPSVARQALNGLVLLDDGAHFMTQGVSSRRSNGGKSAPRPTPTKAMQLFDHLEIYPGCKLAHFRCLHAKTGIEYNDMGTCVLWKCGVDAPSSGGYTAIFMYAIPTSSHCTCLQCLCLTLSPPSLSPNASLLR